MFTIDSPAHHHICFMTTGALMQTYVRLQLGTPIFP